MGTHNQSHESNTEVDFTNILRAAFLLIFFCQKITNTNCKYQKAVEITFVQKLIEKCW